MATETVQAHKAENTYSLALHRKLCKLTQFLNLRRKRTVFPHDSQNVLVPHPGQLPFSPCAPQALGLPRASVEAPTLCPCAAGGSSGLLAPELLGLSSSDRNTENLPQGGPCICPAAFVYFRAWVTNVCCSPTFCTHSCPFSLGQASWYQHSYQFLSPGGTALTTSWLDTKPGRGRGCCCSETPCCSQ